MAEAAGLALGAVALVSLFQTAVECLEYFELARDLRHDQELATTKVGLLVTRLKEWGNDLQVSDPGQEDGGLRRRWGEEGGLIAQSLTYIASILSNAAVLSRNYGLHKERRFRLSTTFPRAFRHPRSGLTPQSTISPGSPHSIKETVSFRRQVVWAIRDKKRFDSLIYDLDFLITNLEKVRKRLHRLESFELGFPKDEVMSRTRTMADLQSDNFQGPGQTTGGSSAHGQQQQASPPNPPQKKEGNIYTKPEAFRNSSMINGDLGYETRQSNVYNEPRTTDDARMINGNARTGNDVAAAIGINHTSTNASSQNPPPEPTPQEDQDGDVKMDY